MRGETFGEEYKQIDWNILKRLLTFLKPYKIYVIAALLLTILTSAVAPLRPYLTKIAIDQHLAKNDMHGLLVYLIIILSVMIFHGILSFFMTYIMQWVGQKVLLDIRIKLFEHIQKLNMSYLDKNPVGRLVTRVTNDVETLNQLFSSGVVTIFADVLLIMWIVGFMFFTEWKLALLTLTILPALLLATSIFRKKVRVLFKDLRKEVSKMNSFLNEFLSGMLTVKLFSMENSQNAEFDEINKKTRKLNVDTIFYYAVFFPTVEMLSAIALSLIIWYSASNILSGVMTIGILIAFIQYAEMFFRPVRDLSEKYTTLQNAMVAAERIFALLDTEDQAELEIDTFEFQNFKDKIEFQNINFSYDGVKPVLKNINFEIRKGETIAIVGATGSGKTTIINLLCKFYEVNDGKILIDGIDINLINRKSFRRKTALVMQDVFLFSRTIAENIAFDDSEVSQKQILEAAKALGASEFIDNLPNKYLEKVSERGSTLSAGQRQLISFCRAFAANPDILILDEATSSIDTQTEVLINNSLEKLLTGRTSIIIAHRLSTIKRADKILVLHHGELRESGTHDELLALGGLYSKLYKLQYEKSA